jgi:hypothetical protein
MAKNSSSTRVSGAPERDTGTRRQGRNKDLEGKRERGGRRGGLVAVAVVWSRHSDNSGAIAPNGCSGEGGALSLGNCSGCSDGNGVIALMLAAAMVVLCWWW